jgi:hypothetical protein
MTQEKQVYIAWIGFQRRPESMRPAFGYSLHYVPPPFKARWLRPVGYLVQLWRTMRIVLGERADVAWVQMPPNFLAHYMVLLRALTGRPRRIIADCHNSALRPPWSEFPLLVRMLNRVDVVIAHNEEIGRDVARMGVDPARLVVFETRPAQVSPPAVLPARGDLPTILVPCSFNSDEPIDVLLAAAALAPDIHFRVTGNVAKAQARGFVDKAPANLEFTGFLTKEDYDRSLFTSDALLGLTTIEGVQLSVANEAVGAGKAMVLSDTAILRTLFGAAALFAPNEPQPLAAACREAVARAPELDARSAELRIAREQRWAGQAAHVAALARIATDLPQAGSGIPNINETLPPM